MTALKGPDLELQEKLVVLLKADADLMALLAGGINPNQTKTWPGSYLEIGEGDNVPDLAECIDGSELYYNLHLWSREDGNFAHISQIAATAWRAISAATITMTENRLVHIERGRLTKLRDPDGTSLHGVLVIRALTEPAA